MNAQWESDKLGLKVHAAGDTKNKFTEVGLSSTTSASNGAKVTLKGNFDNLKKKFSFITKAENNDLAAEIAYNTADKDPVLSVSKAFNGNDEISPSISLKTGAVSYKYNRKINGGKVEADFHPGENLVLEWKDQGSNGVWTTKADIPVDNTAGTKVSFSREWTY